MPVTIPTQNPNFATLVGSSSQTLTLNNCTALTVYSVGGNTAVATATQTINVVDGVSLEMSPNSPFSFGYNNYYTCVGSNSVCSLPSLIISKSNIICKKNFGQAEQFSGYRF
jgi:hypothetical protein